MTPETLRVAQIAAEFETIRKHIATLQAGADTGTNWEVIIAPLQDRLSVLTRAMVCAQAATNTELTHKATVLMDWLGPKDDLPTQLAASLCRDIVLMFPIMI